MTAAAGITVYTREELEAMTKNRLCEICSLRGISLGSGVVKADIVNAILESQEG